MGCFGRKLRCAFTGEPCFFCCLKNLKESTTTRLSYSIILVSVAVFSIASHEGGLIGSLHSKFRDDLNKFCLLILAGENCTRFTGYIGIYRICLPLFLFHTLMALMTIGVSSSRSFRGKIHNGFWAWKVLLLVSMYIGAYIVQPLENFVLVWMILGIVGGLVFIYVQHITLIDFAYEVNGMWHIKSKNQICYTFCIYFCTILLYLGTAAAYALFIIYYGLPYRCSLNLTMTGINGGLTALFAICSIFSDTLQKKQLWLPGAVTSAFVAFLTWSALGSQPAFLSSDVPWLRRAVSNSEQNLTVHPLLVVADNLNRILSDQFVTERVSNISNLPSLRINQCLPGGVGTLADHLGQDMFTFFGMVLVIGGSLYSSFRTTLQARRLGIRTKREKLKRLLAPIPERPEPMEKMVPKKKPKRKKDETDAVPPEYLSIKEVKRQERALNMLADAVEHLPDPKIFRRPSSRQPNAIVASKPGSSKTDQAASPGFLPSFPEPSPTGPSPKPSKGEAVSKKSTLRVSSSVPDLSITLRQLSKDARRRVDIRDFEWNLANNHNQTAATLKQPSGLKRQSKLPRKSADSGPFWMDDHLEHVLHQLHSKSSKVTKKRPDTKRFPSGKPKRKALPAVTDEDSLLELAHLSPDILPENVGTHFFPTNGPSAPFPVGKKPSAPQPRKRSPMSPVRPLSISLLDSDFDYPLPWCSPNHLRYRYARSASDLVLSKHGSRILESQPNLAASFAFLAPMLTVDAPRDAYLIYNEAIASVYSYPWFHFIYALATLYLMTQLTNWFNPQISGVHTLSGSWANMWMKLASSWIALLLYAWTIACPRFCIGRKLGETPLTPRTPRMKTNPALPV